MVLDAWQNKKIKEEELNQALHIFAKTYLKTISSYERVDLFSASFWALRYAVQHVTCSLLDGNAACGKASPPAGIFIHTFEIKSNLI